MVLRSSYTAIICHYHLHLRRYRHFPLLAIYRYSGIPITRYHECPILWCLVKAVFSLSVVTIFWQFPSYIRLPIWRYFDPIILRFSDGAILHPDISTSWLSDIMVFGYDNIWICRCYDIRSYIQIRRHVDLTIFKLSDTTIFQYSSISFFFCWGYGGN